MTKLKKIDRSIGLVEEGVSIASLVIIVVLVVAQVFFRYVLDGSILWADEVVLNLMVLMVMFGASAVTRRMLHTDLKMFVDFLPKSIGRILRIITTTIGFLFLCVFLYASAKYTFDARGMSTTVLKIPMPYMYSIMIFGSLLLLYEYIKTIPLSLKGGR